MQVFKTFIKVTTKRIHVAMIYIVIFLVIGFLMGANSTKVNNFEDTKLSVSIIDLDETKASKALIEYIDSKHKIVDIENNKDEITDALYYNRVDYVLTINKGYSKKLSNSETNDLFSNYKMPDSFNNIFIETQIDEYVRIVSAYVAGGMSLDEATVKSAKLVENEVVVEMVNDSENVNEGFNDNITFYYQFLPYILTAVLITGLCPTLLVMMKKEIKNRTNCSCVSVTSQMIQIVAGTIIFAIAVYMLLSIVAFMIYGSNFITSNGFYAMFNGFVFLLFAMMLTFFIAVIAPSPKTVDMIANTVSLGMSFLCGVFVPQYLLSGIVLSIGKFLPAYWYIKANNMIWGESGEIFKVSKYISYIGIEFAFSIILFCMILIVSKSKQRSKTV